MNFQNGERSQLRTARLGHPLRHVIRTLHGNLESLAAEATLPAGARVLDFGCADRFNRRLVGDAVQYVGVDLPGNPQADAAINMDGSLPYEDGSFDMVMSTQVLEHVENPPQHLREAHRVLRAGGLLLLSTHGMMIYHPDPTDYWRWTSDGLRRIVEEAGFEIVEMRGIMGLAAVGLHFFQTATYPRLPRFLRPVYAALMQGLVALCDRLHSDRSRLHNALVYAVLARRRESAA